MVETATMDVESIAVEVRKPGMEKTGTMRKLQSQATGLKRKSIEMAKKNPKKAAGCGSCVCISIVTIIVLGVAAGVGLFYARHFFFGGDSRTAKAGGAAMSQGGRETLIPVRKSARVIPCLPPPAYHASRCEKGPPSERLVPFLGVLPVPCSAR